MTVTVTVTVSVSVTVTVTEPDTVCQRQRVWHCLPLALALPALPLPALPLPLGIKDLLTPFWLFSTMPPLTNTTNINAIVFGE